MAVVIVAYAACGVAVGIVGGRRFFLQEQSQYPRIAAEMWTSDVLFSALVGFALGVVWPGTLLGVGARRGLMHFHPNNKEKRNGSNRGAEASPSDPGDRTFATGGPVFTSITGLAALNYPGSASARLNPAPPREVEHVQGDMPILAHRVAGLVFNGDGNWFVPLGGFRSFGVDAEARCERSRVQQRNGAWSSGEGPSHIEGSPALDCSCGFYALPSDIDPWLSAPSLVTLQVELSGTVIEHERGYRAQHQRVIEVQIPPCAFCGDDADVIVTGEDRAMTDARCNRHLPPHLAPGHLAIPVPDLPSLLGAPVTTRKAVTT